MKKTQTLTHEQLKEVLSYDKETGVFVWVKGGKNRALGRVAGSVDNNGYIRIHLSGEFHSAHRLAWFYVHGNWPKYQIDHINTIKTDNKLSNLREATASQNLCNRGMLSNNTSGIKGVTWNKTVEKWQAQCKIKGVSYYLGCYSDIENAANSYATFAKATHGEFYRKAV